MEQQGLRDVDRWKDKIEVRLDNRQVAFLFFGSALVACLLFVLGVIVGKRLESRGRALAPGDRGPPGPAGPGRVDHRRPPTRGGGAADQRSQRGPREPAGGAQDRWRPCQAATLTPGPRPTSADGVRADNRARPPPVRRPSPRPP